MANYRIMNLLDKWKEATYHLSLMKKYGNLFIKTEDITPEEKGVNLRNFRYEFNAFVNCCRSVTFVLQKTFKRNDGFDEWYSEKQRSLGSNSFAKTLNILRTLNQKEGNFYPHIISVSKVNEDFTFRTTYSAVPQAVFDDPQISKHLINGNFQLEQNPNEEEIIEYENPEGVSFEEVREEMQQILIREYIKEYKKSFNKITQDQLQNMTFLRYEISLCDEPNLSMEDFLEKCLDHIYLLRDICQEAEKRFLD